MLLYPFITVLKRTAGSGAEKPKPAVHTREFYSGCFFAKRSNVCVFNYVPKDLCPEGFTTATGLGCVGVSELETATNHGVAVI